MNNITHIFNLAVMIMVGVLFLAAVAFVVYTHWKKSGQERGI